MWHRFSAKVSDANCSVAWLPFVRLLLPSGCGCLNTESGSISEHTRESITTTFTLRVRLLSVLRCSIVWKSMMSRLSDVSSPFSTLPGVSEARLYKFAQQLATELPSEICVTNHFLRSSAYQCSLMELACNVRAQAFHPPPSL